MQTFTEYSVIKEIICLIMVCTHRILFLVFWMQTFTEYSVIKEIIFIHQTEQVTFYLTF
jgi:hypothetical protein